MHLKNCWYVAAWHHEIDDGLLARKILNEPVVLYRGEDGAAVALEDRCVHRHLPLSCGQRVGNDLRCGYHGLVFDRTGACIEVPGQTKVPPDARVKTFPVVEKWRWIWIWMGDPAKADPALIPDFHWNDDPAWISVGDRYHVAGAAELLIDNLLDLSHVQFVHASTIGTDAITGFPVEVERGDDRVHVTRWIMDNPAPPMFAKASGIDGNVDRWQLIAWTPPTHVVIDVGCAVAGTGAREGNRSQGITMFSNHSITPETESSCHYFWHHARDFNLGDDALTDFQKKAAGEAFSEDVVIIEAQQKSLDRAPGWEPACDITADAGVLQARRMLSALLDAERKAGR